MAKSWQIDPAEIPDEAVLNEFKLWDSLGHVTMLLALESEFGLQLNEDNVQKLRTIPAIVEALEHIK